MRDRVKRCIDTYKDKIVFGLSAMYAGCAACSLLNTAGFADQVDGVGFTQSVLAVVLFLVLGYFLQNTLLEYRQIDDIKKKRRRSVFALLFGSVLGLSLIWGYELRLDGMTSPGYMAKLKDVLVAFGLGIAFFPLTSKWFGFLDNGGTPKQMAELSKKTKWKIFWWSLVFILACWLPVFLAYYPAIMSYDFHRQSGEAYNGYIWFNDHHPLVHTFLIRMFLLLGEKIGSYEVGMAIFSILQMLCLAAVLAYSCNVVCRIAKRVWPMIVMVIFYGLLPVHPVLAMSMTKDILFTAFFLLLVLLVWERKRATTGKVWLFGAILLTGILTLLLRNNAVYAFAVFAVFYVIISAGERMPIIILCLAIMIGGIGGKVGIREAMDAGSGSSSEMFSVMMQQFARVGANQGQNLSIEDASILNQYVPEEIWGEYNPTIADSIKGMVAAYYYDSWQEDITGMLVNWARIGLRYPNDYIDAFLALTSGYWFLDDVSHAEVLGYGADTNRGLLYTFNAANTDVFAGVKNQSVLPGLLECYQKIVNGNSYYSWPVVSILFKPAFYCWLMLLSMVSLWYKKEPKKQLLTLLPFLYLLTLLLGPVVHIRYVYPIMVTVPVMLAEVIGTRIKNHTI